MVSKAELTKLKNSVSASDTLAEKLADFNKSLEPYCAEVASVKVYMERVESEKVYFDKHFTQV